MSKKITLLAGSVSVDLGKKIAKALGIELVDVVLTEFKDGEVRPSIEESIRGSDVFIVQSTHSPIENFWELLLMGDAAKRASATSITAIVPYFGNARQDRKDKPRVPITAKLVADCMKVAGFSRIITMDLHADQIQGFFDFPVDNLYASALFVSYISNLGLKESLVMASPDAGGARRAGKYAKFLGVEMVMCYKSRDKANEVSEMRLIGDVKDKDVVLIDDIIDTGGSLAKAANLMMENGAKSVRALCTHPVLSGDACKKIDESALTELVVCDTIPLKCNSNKIKILPIEGLFADAISRVHKDESISSLFKVT